MPASMSSNYAIVEPHPSVVPSKSYIYSGRGGAGNAFRAPKDITSGPNATGPAARASFSSLSKPRLSFTSGRGGAGNIHTGSERAIFSFDEELERQLAHQSTIAPVHHVGRGGAGNITRQQQSKPLATRRDSEDSARSTSSTESGADFATRKFKEGFKRVVSRS